MVAHRNHFSGWQDETFACACGWSGTAKTMQMELFAALVEFSCRECDAHLILVSHPTRDDIKAAAASGNEEALSMLSTLSSEEVVDERKRETLRAPSQLPDVVSDRELGGWLNEARATPVFAAFWDDAPATTRAYVLACFAKPRRMRS